MGGMGFQEEEGRKMTREEISGGQFEWCAALCVYGTCMEIPAR